MNIIINNSQKAECFAGIFQHIKLFTEQINILFEKERMYIQAMDSSRISIFEITLPKEWFDLYEHTSDAPFNIGINSSIMFRVLNARDKSQKINLVFDNIQNEKLEIHFTQIGLGNNKNNPSGSFGEFDKHFEISLLNIDADVMIIPEIEYQAEFTIVSSNFANIINQLKMFGSNLDLECSEDKIVLYSNSLEQGKMFVEIKIDDLTSFVIDEGEIINMSFSLAYLHNICLYNKLSKEVEVKFKSDFPMKMIYNLGGHPDAKMVFYLAPKINEE